MAEPEKNNTPASGTRKPPPKKRRPEEDPSKADAETAEDTIRQAVKLLDPLIDFHKSVEAATMDDLRIYWDVRIVRGPDSPFTHVAGSSSLPRALAPNMQALAPAAIQQEVLDRIAKPLTAVFQTEAEQQTMEELASRDDDSLPDAGEAEGLC